MNSRKLRSCCSSFPELLGGAVSWARWPGVWGQVAREAAASPYCTIRWLVVVGLRCLYWGGPINKLLEVNITADFFDVDLF